ncbi:MAG: hypothetical protein Q8936_10965 [Bacillota bacterium]|nr:hypothetical protein [Bacillota bacterium]
MDVHKSMASRFLEIIKYMFFLVFLIISFLTLAVSPLLDYMCKKNFAFSNIILFIFDILVFSIILGIWKVFGKRFFNVIDKYATKFILVFSIVLFLGQVYLCYNIYFLSGWDAGYVFQAAKMIASRVPLGDFNAYFSRYPNNITLTWIYLVIIKVSAKLGIVNIGNGLGAIIILNCFISSLSSFLTYKSVEKLTNKGWAVFSWILYLLLLGTSSWILITYSDPFALFLPILIFFIYTRDLKDKYSLAKWFAIGIFSFFGYHIKPQVIIILIAIMIIELVRFLFLSNIEKKRKCIIMGILLFTLFLSNISYQAITKYNGFNLDKEDAFGMSHFVMMGLNVKTDGAYSGDDIAYSASFKTSSERERANIEAIKERLNNFSAINYIKFISKKILVNYGDGTFAWGAEGNFYAELYPDKNSWLSPMLKSFFYSGRKNYIKTSTLEQSIWVGTIVSMLGIILIKRNQMNKEIAVLMLSILGLTAFELLFEARARYLFIYAPIYISLSTVGLKSIVYNIKLFIEKWHLNAKVENNIE